MVDDRGSRRRRSRFDQGPGAVRRSIIHRHESSLNSFALRRLLVLQALIWTTYAVVHFAASLPAILDEERGVMAMAGGVRAVTGLVITSMLAPVLERFRNLGRFSLVSAASGAALLAGVAWTFADRTLLVMVASVFRIEIPWDRFVRGMDLEYFFVMAAWTAGYLTLLLIGRNQSQRETLLRQEVEMQEVRLSLLASQLNPHFLFNSLNTIRSLAAEDPSRTRDVVSRLSSFLRRVINVNPSVPVALSDEIDLARDYLDVEQARFENGLEVTIEVEPSVSGTLVPPLILQPLLENAIKHGEPVNGVRTVAVSGSMRGDRAAISVSNSGSLARYADGTGLRLTRARLEQTFGQRHSFLLAEARTTVIATITLPVARGS